MSQAVAHADFPQTLVCGEPAGQAVSGHAFIVSEQTEPALLPALTGFVSIPASGGLDEQNLHSVSVPVASSGTATSRSWGSNGLSSSQASSEAYVEELCLLPGESGGCTVGATALRSQSNSAADADGAASDDIGTEFLGLTVGGTPIATTPEPNTVVEIPGVATVVLNEQFCDNGADLATGCLDATGHHAGLTVRAIHVILLDPESFGAEVIVGEAHSDATFVPPVLATALLTDDSLVTTGDARSPSDAGSYVGRIPFF